MKLHAFADDEQLQLYDSDCDPVANTWYAVHRMIVNPDKHHAMVLGSPNHQFSFKTEESLDLLEVTIDNQLSFDKQVSLTCKKIKVNNQLRVMIRFRKLVNTSTMLKLYRAFVLLACVAPYSFPFSGGVEIGQANEKRVSEGAFVSVWKRKGNRCYAGYCSATFSILLHNMALL